MRIALPPSLSALEPGDVVQLEPGQDARAWRIVELEGGLSRRAELRAIRLAASPAFAGADETARQAEAHAPASRPLTHVFEIYGEGGGVFVAAFVQPWRGPLDIWAGPSIERLTKRALIERPAVAGVLTRPLPAGDEGRWHRQLGLEVRLHDGALASRTELDVLAGRGLAALQGEAGWELVAFETAELVAPDIWRLDGLLRRLGGGPAGALAAEGAAFIRLDGAAVRLNVEAWEREAPLVVIVVPAGAALDDPSASTATITPRALGLQPLSPVHGWARRGSDGLEAVWIRRTRLGGDDWAARDAPLGEEEERYVVRVRAAGGALLAETECSEPGFSMPVSALDALSEPPAFLEVAQVSRAAGEGARLRIDVLG